MSDEHQAERTALRAAWASRADGFRRFAAWEAAHPRRLAPADAVAAAAWLYDLLPAESRARAIETAGVRKLHEALSRLRPRR
jgi:hypothetical protein